MRRVSPGSFHVAPRRHMETGYHADAWELIAGAVAFPPIVASEIGDALRLTVLVRATVTLTVAAAPHSSVTIREWAVSGEDSRSIP